jgi:hypothetical protein
LAVVVDLFAIETEVAERTAKVMKEMRELRDICATHGLALPAAIARVLGEASPPLLRQPTSSKMTIPAPQWERPDGAQSSWIRVSEDDAIVVSLVLATLRQAQVPLTPSQIGDLIEKKRPSINRGSIANLGTRLDGKLIRRVDGGWTLLHMERAPVPHHGYLWGPVEVFEKTEVASYRRDVLKHVLEASPDGLQIMQLTHTLEESCPWLDRGIPVSKDLIKMDMRELEQKKVVRRMGPSGKWELTP